MKILSDKEFKEIKETIEMYKEKYNVALEDYYKCNKGMKLFYNNYIEKLNENEKLRKSLEEAQQLFNENYYDMLDSNCDKLNKLFDKALGSEE